MDLEKAENDHMYTFSHFALMHVSYEINPAQLPELSQLRDQRDQIHQKMEQELSHVASECGVSEKQIKLIETTQWGMVLRVTKKVGRQCHFYVNYSAG